MKPTPVETSEEIEIAASLWAVKERPLSADDEAELADWLAGDPRRRGAMLRAQATWETLARAKALGARSERQGSYPAQAGKLTRRRLLAAAGAGGGLMAAGIAGIAVLQQRDKANTRMGEIRRMPMSDGSVAAINSESTIRIDMTSTQRKVDLIRGEAWFKVAKNKERPFVVAAGPARVQAVGTAFSVNRRDGGAEVLVTEGTVKAWIEGSDTEIVWLNAGDRTFIGPKTEVKVDHAPEAIDSALAWRDGQIVLDGKTLTEAAAEYNRYNQLKIVIQDPALGRERLLGRFRTDDPDTFSDAVAQAFGAEITRTDKAIYIDVKK